MSEQSFQEQRKMIEDKHRGSFNPPVLKHAPIKRPETLTGGGPQSPTLVVGQDIARTKLAEQVAAWRKEGFKNNAIARKIAEMGVIMPNGQPVSESQCSILAEEGGFVRSKVKRNRSSKQDDNKQSVDLDGIFNDIGEVVTSNLSKETKCQVIKDLVKRLP